MNRKKILKWMLFITIPIIVYLLFVIVEQQEILMQKEQAIRNVQAKIEEEKRLNEELKRQKEILNTYEYVESVAREKLGMVKPGEKIFIVVD